jgi:hypothetical protein
MSYTIKVPGGKEISLTHEQMQMAYENATVESEWPAKEAGAGDWVTVGAVLQLPGPEGRPGTPGDVKAAASRRYQDAYLVARTTTGIGALVKVIGIALGVLILLALVIVGSQTDKVLQSFGAGLLAGAVVAVPLYVLGVLVSAVGQNLKATLDTAVHGSPFLMKEDMARIMSL